MIEFFKNIYKSISDKILGSTISKKALEISRKALEIFKKERKESFQKENEKEEIKEKKVEKETEKYNKKEIEEDEEKEIDFSEDEERELPEKYRNLLYEYRRIKKELARAYLDYEIKPELRRRFYKFYKEFEEEVRKEPEEKLEDIYYEISTSSEYKKLLGWAEKKLSLILEKIKAYSGSEGFMGEFKHLIKHVEKNAERKYYYVVVLFTFLIKKRSDGEVIKVWKKEKSFYYTYK